MDLFGFVRVTTAVPQVTVADVDANLQQHRALLAELDDSDLIVFPELSLTGYTCGDLFAQRSLLDEALIALETLAAEVTDRMVVVVGLPLYVDGVGGTFNVAAVLHAGRILGIVPKSFLPNYREFYEARWFVPATGHEPSVLDFNGELVPFGTDLLFEHEAGGWKFGVEICEDVWSPIPPSTFQALAGATILVNLSASNEIIGKAQFRRDFVKGQTGKLLAGYVYCSAGPTESTSDLVFGGHCLIGENGSILAETPQFVREPQALTTEIDVDKLRHERATQPGTFAACAARNRRPCRTIRFQQPPPAPRARLHRTIASHPFVPSDAATLHERCAEIFGIQCSGLAKRVEQLPHKNVYIGVSGGLDSTLALLVAVKTFDLLGIPRAHIHGLTMPGFGTSAQTKSNALKLMDVLAISQETIDIRETSLGAFKALRHSPLGMTSTPESPLHLRFLHAGEAGIDVEAFQRMLEDLPAGINDLTFENVQARLRTFYLMSRGFVLGTGDLSESALGWCTYNGDHMSMYNVNCSIPKTLVKFLVQYVAESESASLDPAGTAGSLRPTLMNIVGTTISPELLPTKAGAIQQSTEDTLGPYELHDFYLYHFQRNGFAPEKILYLAAMAFGGRYSVEVLRQHLRTFLQRFFHNQFKRNCVPDGPKVGSVSLSPRGDWRMPSDAAARLWLDRLEAPRDSD